MIICFHDLNDLAILKKKKKDFKRDASSPRIINQL